MITFAQAKPLANSNWQRNLPFAGDFAFLLQHIWILADSLLVLTHSYISALCILVEMISQWTDVERILLHFARDIIAAGK